MVRGACRQVPGLKTHLDRMVLGFRIEGLGCRMKPESHGQKQNHPQFSDSGFDGPCFFTCIEKLRASGSHAPEPQEVA